MYNFVVRILDLFFAIIAVAISLPFLVPIIIILRFTAEGEVFYLQERMGYKNRKFKVFKFATMLKNSLNMGTGSITLINDFRVTSVGKYLRKTKVNELPQLINVIKGDISFVGPRPILEEDWKLYPTLIRKKIYDVRPGLTGIGSIVFRDEESLISSIKNENPHEYYKRVVAPYKGELEMWYQKNKSFFVDLKIISLTAWVIFYPDSKLYQKWFKDVPRREF